MTADDIIKLLAVKHSADVFVSECKTGATLNRRDMQRLDAWAMPRSWAHPDVTAYEVKVNRSDFVNDTKWPEYLQFCNAFYFVCPYQMIKPNEVSNGVGLIWASKTGGRLFTKVKAGRRDQNIPESLFRYILMSRAKITVERGDYSAKTYWAAWEKECKLDRDFGCRIAGKIQKAVREKIDAVESENIKLRDRQVECDALLQTLKDMGFADRDLSSSWRFSETLRNKLSLAETGMPEGLENAIDRARNGLVDAARLIERTKQRS